MDPTLFATLALGTMLILIVIGIPVALSIMGVTLIGMYLSVGPAFLLSTSKTLIYASSSNYAFAVIPMFILMGEIAGGSRIIADLYQACYRWIGHLRGGVYNSTVLASAGFAAISGSTVVNAAVFTRVALPEIERLGYNKGFGAGCIAASGTLAAMIPPSLTMVLYGILTEQSIGALLIAGILPGLLTAGMLMATVYVSVLLRKDLSPKNSEIFTLKQKISGLKDIWPAMLLATIVLTGIYTGTGYRWSRRRTTDCVSQAAHDLAIIFTISKALGSNYCIIISYNYRWPIVFAPATVQRLGIWTYRLYYRNWIIVVCFHGFHRSRLFHLRHVH